MHLRSVLKDTAVFAALGRVLGRGGLVVGVGPAAAALSDPMFDVRGGGFTLGLGLATGVAIIPESETWSAEALARSRSLATTPMIVLPTGSAAIRQGDQWELHGEADATGDLG
jgi:cyanophycinase